ncbi:endonuclease/exonuclease/phosphatase family protein [Filimonas effusa]|uniref:Endonuclease/exonuclease/phosphatase family protein n=1 Tax=Filimonas effusa TaxID=2508721 RepID=A0A4Q1D6I3_9BACT|nr:endonuclease/exonuclease/phosphatase family protein [Filimonas effusa]RXK83596.1 endonuclease/exonuclease/phosphatase family protein [Filimonas effusa]
MNFIKITTIVTAILLAAVVQAQNYTVGSYNLRFACECDSGNLWINRAPAVAALIRFHQYDILGTQEALVNQLDDLSKTLQEYDRYGAGRNDGKSGGEHSAIFFRKDKFQLLQKGDFWLSETPDTPSLCWDAKCCNRICSWVKLKDKKTGAVFFFFNAHFDHQGQIARVESSKLILRKIKEIARKAPVLFTGDLNGGYDSGCYKLLADSQFLKDASKTAPARYINNGTFNNFGRNISSDIIDHIFTSSAFTAKKYAVLTDTYNGKYPSDHFPVWAIVSLKK